MRSRGRSGAAPTRAARWTSGWSAPCRPVRAPAHRSYPVVILRPPLSTPGWPDVKASVVIGQWVALCARGRRVGPRRVPHAPVPVTQTISELAVVFNASSTAVRRMRVSSLVVAPRSTTVVAALSAADYYDGYLPPGLLVSTDGARSFGFERRLSNHNVVSLAVDARGRVCAATNGDGYQCVQIGRRQ